MDCNLIFVNTTPDGNDGMFYAKTFQFETLRRAIPFPFKTSPSESVKDQGSLVQDVLGGLDHRMNVVCFTNYGSNLERTLDIASEIRKRGKKHQLMLLAGGPAMVREKIAVDGGFFPDSIETTLHKEAYGSPVYDGAVFGGIGALLQLIQGSEGIDGFYIREGGKGFSSYPALPVAPYLLKEHVGIIELETMFNSLCPNRCDFCSRGSFMDNSEESLREALDEIGAEKRGVIRIISIADPNPLHPSNINNTYNLADYIETMIGNSTIKSAMVDSGLLREPDSLFSHLRALRIHNMFIGMDAAGGKDADIMGTRYQGRVKTEEEIRTEYTGLVEVVNMMGETGEPYQMCLSYIHMPHEDGRKALSSIQMLYGSLPKNIKLISRVKPLEVYPGTALLHRAAKANLLVDDPYFQRDGPSMWRKGIDISVLHRRE